jgi:PAS domain S-box-containing protein
MNQPLETPGTPLHQPLFPASLPESADFRLTDLITEDHLQAMLKRFSSANGVICVIHDREGNPVVRQGVVRPSCFWRAGESCIAGERLVHRNNAARSGCRLSEATEPILIDGRHVGDWTIGMCGFGGIIGPFVEESCTGAEQYDALYARMAGRIKAHFDGVCSLLKLAVADVVKQGYSNLQLMREQIRRREDEVQIERSKGILSSIFDHSADGILLVGKDGIVTDWGRGYELLSGIPRGEMIGRDIRDAVCAMLAPDEYTPEEIEQERRRMTGFLTRAEQATVTRTLINRQTGRKHIIHSLYFPVRYSGAEMMGAISRDITENMEREQKLEAYTGNLEHLVRERTEEMEAANEELYATNEELYATNEEFSVTNEELQEKNNRLNREIAARLEAMQKLEDSESKMRNFIAQSFEGIVIIDDEGRIIEWNPEQEQITGVPRREALGQHAWDIYRSLMPEDRADELAERYRQWQVLHFLSPGSEAKSGESEHIIYRPDGTQQYITVVSFRIKLTDTCYVGEIVRDTTEHKLMDWELERYRTQLEEMVAAQTRELIESKERLTSLSDNLPGGAIFRMSSSGQGLVFTYISARFEEIFRLPVADAMADSSLFFNLCHPADRENLLLTFSGESRSSIADVEYRVCPGYGETEWIHLRSLRRLNDDGSLVWDGFITDITERKRAGQELEETRRRQAILIKVLQTLQSIGNMHDAIDAALAEIGEYAGVSRSYIFEKAPDGKTVDNTYEWCGEGINPEIHNLQSVPVEYMADWFDTFDNGEFVCVSDIRDLSPIACEKLESQGIKSIVVLPLKTDGVVYGFVGFDECTEYRTWQRKEVELLISLSQIISTTAIRFRAQKAMQLSQHTMRTVLDNIGAAIYVAAFNTYELLFANKTVKDQMGGDIEGKKCWQVIQKDMTGPCPFCPKGKLLDADRNPTGIYRWEFQNSNTGRWFECTDAAVEWVDGRMVHMEYATDVTDRRNAEEAVHRSEELYRQLTVASPDAIVVCSPQGKVVYMSPKAKELFLISDGREPETLQMLRYVHSHDLRTSVGQFRSLATEGVSFVPQLLLKRGDGSDFFGEISAATVKDDHNRTTSIIMVIRDITRRRITETELILAKERAEESDKLKSAFLANMSHEIRTPLNGILGFLNFLADDNLAPARRRDYAAVVNNSSVQLVKLIDDIIDIAKIEARQMSIRPSVLRLNGLMKDLQMFFETYLNSNNKDRIALVLDDSGFITPDTIYVDPIRLRQILTNVIGNAVKFTEKGYIGFGYRLLPPDRLEFWVEETGIGLPPDQLEVIFERFRQAELSNSRKYGGTGLGLTISRNLSRMMGGDLQVESAEGQGSTFRFTITYLPVDAVDEPLLEEAGSETAVGPLSGMSVLLVEPDTMTSRYCEKLLKAAGATVIHAETVQEWMGTVSRQKHIHAVLAGVRVFLNAAGDAPRAVRSVRSGLPLVLAIPERNGYYTRLIAESNCNGVIEGTGSYAKLCEALRRYV